MRRLTLAILIMFVAGLARADERIAGTWALDRASSDDVNKAIDATVKKMNVITRSIARGRLKKTNPAYERISISFSGANARISAGPGAPVVLPSSGAPVKWKRADGETFTVAGRTQGSSYVETFDAKDGRRTNSFSLTSHDRLVLNVTVTSPRLPTAMRYKLVYRRTAGLGPQGSGLRERSGLPSPS